MNVREIIDRIRLFKAYADRLRKQLYDMTVARDALEQEVTGLRRTLAVVIVQAGGSVKIKPHEFATLDPRGRVEVTQDRATGDMVISVRRKPARIEQNAPAPATKQ